MTMPLGPRIMAPVDCSYLLDDAGRFFLSVRIGRRLTMALLSPPTSRGLGRCYLDFCTAPHLLSCEANSKIFSAEGQGALRRFMIAAQASSQPCLSRL